MRSILDFFHQVNTGFWGALDDLSFLKEEYPANSGDHDFRKTVIDAAEKAGLRKE